MTGPLAAAADLLEHGTDDRAALDAAIAAWLRGEWTPDPDEDVEELIAAIRADMTGGRR